MKFKYILTLALLIFFFTGQAQINTKAVLPNTSLQDYLNKVGQNHIGYAAQKYEVNIAEAGIENARVFPNPEFSLSVFDNQQAKLKLGQGISFGLATTIELGGKRKARIELAKTEVELNKSLLLDYYRNLRADAAIAYFTAIQQKKILQVQTESYLSMKKIADADSIRYKLGAISETDARQSRLEAKNLLNSLYQTEVDWRNTLITLSAYTGNKNPDTLITPVENFEPLDRKINFQDLIEQAQNNRADAIAAINSKKLAQNNLTLIKANRVIDLGVNTSLQYNGVSINEEAPTPYHKTINAGINIPLKISNRYKGDLKMAQFTIKQNELRYDGTLQQIKVEVTQAYFNYNVAEKQVKQYQNGMLTEAKKILEAKIYSYKRGETALIEVLNAQRTHNETQLAYYESLGNYAKTLVELERSSGIWDIK